MTINQRRPIEAVINDYLSERPTILFSNFLPNIEVAKSAIEANEIDEEHHRWRGDVIRDVVRRVAAKLYRNEDGGLRFEFCENPKYRRTLDYAIYDANLDEKGNPKLARATATENMVINGAVADVVALDDEQGILDIVAKVWDALPKSREHIEYVQQNVARERMINEMTQNGSKPFSLRTGNSNSRTYDPQGREIQFSGGGGRRFVSGDQGFADMTDEQVQAMYDQWKLQESYKSMSTEDLRKQVRQQGKERFEQKFNSDPTTGAPITVSTKQLIDPRSNLPFTSKQQLVSFINSNRYATAQLLQRNGKVDPELAREFERILNGR